MTKVANANIGTIGFYVDPQIGTYNAGTGKWTWSIEPSPSGDGHMGATFGLDADGLLVLAPPKIAVGMLGMTAGSIGNKAVGVYDPTKTNQYWTHLVTDIPNDGVGMRGAMAGYLWPGGWKVRGCIGVAGPAGATVYARVMQGAAIDAQSPSHQPNINTGTFPVWTPTMAMPAPDNRSLAAPSVADTRYLVGEGWGTIGLANTIWPIPFEGPDIQFNGDASGKACEVIVEVLATSPGVTALAYSGPLIAATRGLFTRCSGMNAAYGVNYQ